MCLGTWFFQEGSSNPLDCATSQHEVHFPRSTRSVHMLGQPALQSPRFAPSLEVMPSAALLPLVASLLLATSSAAPLATRLRAVDYDSLCSIVEDYLPTFCSCQDVPLGARLACETSLLEIDLGLFL